jgi:hypothetical protein
MKTFAAAVCVVALAGAARASIVQVEWRGSVEFNSVTSQPLAGATVGSAVVMSFQVDSNVFENSASFPTRGYTIIQPSFSFTAGSASLTMQNPFPAGTTPFFVIRDNDPAVDGFFVADNVDFPTGLPLNVNGSFGAYRNNSLATYEGSTLSSLDILGAVGTYDFTGLTNFNWTIDDGPINRVGILFEQVSIAVVPAPANLAVLVPVLAIARRRRRA